MSVVLIKNDDDDDDDGRVENEGDDPHRCVKM